MLIRWDNEITALDVKILKLENIKKISDLPREYLAGWPVVLRDDERVWVAIRGMNIAGGVEINYWGFKEGSMLLKTEWEQIILPAIKEAGDRLHEIMKHTPKTKNNRIVTVII
jgi:hypothetical protein